MNVEYPEPNPFLFISSLDRRRRENKHVGWIYIMRNPAFRIRIPNSISSTDGARYLSSNPPTESNARRRIAPHPAQNVDAS